MEFLYALEALISGAPGDFPWEDLLSPEAAAAMYKLSSWIETDWPMVVMIMVAFIILAFEQRAYNLRRRTVSNRRIRRSYCSRRRSR